MTTFKRMIDSLPKRATYPLRKLRTVGFVSVTLLDTVTKNSESYAEFLLKVI